MRPPRADGGLLCGEPWIRTSFVDVLVPSWGDGGKTIVVVLNLIAIAPWDFPTFTFATLLCTFRHPRCLSTTPHLVRPSSRPLVLLAIPPYLPLVPAGQRAGRCGEMQEEIQEFLQLLLQKEISTEEEARTQLTSVRAT